MSQENVDAFKRGLEAGNRGDVDTLLEVLDPQVAWHSALHALLGGEGTVYRGHAGVREMIGDLYEAFDDFQIEISEVRDRGDRTVAIGRAYLDPDEALEAAG
jgi:ketosteroid isomerase-like protein